MPSLTLSTSPHNTVLDTRCILRVSALTADARAHLFRDGVSRTRDVTVRTRALARGIKLALSQIFAEIKDASVRLARCLGVQRAGFGVRRVIGVVETIPPSVAVVTRVSIFVARNHSQVARTVEGFILRLRRRGDV